MCCCLGAGLQEGVSSMFLQTTCTGHPVWGSSQLLSARASHAEPQWLFPLKRQDIGKQAELYHLLISMKHELWHSPRWSDHTALGSVKEDSPVGLTFPAPAVSTGQVAGLDKEL